MRSKKTTNEALATVNRLLAMAEEISNLANRVGDDEAINDLGAYDGEKPLRDAAEGVAFSAVIISFANGFELRATEGKVKHAK